MATSAPPLTEGLSATDLAGNAEAVAVHGMLDKMVKVTVSDGRVIMGEMKCLDGLGNLVLGSAELARTPEEVEAESTAQRQARWMGSVLVPPQHLVKVEVDPSD